jgi:membrane protein implicated in regulation of membrane protease activity
MKFGIGGVAVGLILLLFLPWWIGVLIIAAAIALPVGAYLMLDPSQRRRLREIQRRKQLGR